MEYGLPEGAKTLADSLNSSRDAARSLSQSIEGIQQDGLDVAKQKAQELHEQAIASLGLPSSLARIADDLVFLDWGTALVFLWRVKHVVGRSEEVLESFSDVHFIFSFCFLFLFVLQATLMM